MSYRSNFFQVAAASLVLATVGCGLNTTKSEGEKARETDIDIAGEWRDDCRSAGWLGLTHRREQFGFNAIGDYRHITTSYDAEGCQAPQLTLEISGTFQALGNSPAVNGAKYINFSTTTASLKPESDGAAKSLNDQSYCEFSDWKVGSARDILNVECGGATKTKGEIVFDLYRLNESKNELRLGKDSLFIDGSRADLRPQAINETHVFHRQ